MGQGSFILLAGFLSLPRLGKSGLAPPYFSHSDHRLPGWRGGNLTGGEQSKAPLLMTSGVDPDSSLQPRLTPNWPSATPPGFRGALHSLSVLAWQSCTPASPVAPALLFTLKTAKCATPSFRGQGGVCHGAPGGPGLFKLSWDLPSAHAPRTHLPKN
jgi:hypothetical protein